MSSSCAHLQEAVFLIFLDLLLTELMALHLRRSAFGRRFAPYMWAKDVAVYTVLFIAFLVLVFTIGSTPSNAVLELILSGLSRWINENAEVIIPVVAASVILWAVTGKRLFSTYIVALCMMRVILIVPIGQAALMLQDAGVVRTVRCLFGW